MRLGSNPKPSPNFCRWAKFTYKLHSERKQVQAHEVRLKLRVSEWVKIYFQSQNTPQSLCDSSPTLGKHLVESGKVKTEFRQQQKPLTAFYFLHSYFYLYSKKIHGILDKSGTLPRHSLMVRVLAYSPPQVQPHAMQLKRKGENK